MKNLLLAYCFVLCVASLEAQNLVNNPSFETFTSCPTTINQGTPDQVSYATDWYSSLGTPDYYNSCAPVASHVSVPNNLFGHQYAATGNAYCGFHCYDQGSNYREILSSQLSSTLLVGQTYFVSFKISFGDNINPLYYGIASDKMGVKFSTVQYNILSPPPINNVAHVYSSAIITDTLNWVQVRGSFIADSLYQFINIGNFFDDAHTDTLQMSGTGNEYYYLDDICVSTDSNTCYPSSTEFIQELSFPKLIVYPNPANYFIVIEQTKGTMNAGMIYNVLGEQITEFKTTGSDKIIIDCSQWSDGLYFIESKFEKLKIIINHNH